MKVDDRIVGKIGPGFLLLVGIGAGDTEAEVRWMARKVAGLRVFRDDEGRMNRSLLEAHGSALVVSQFTLHGDCRKGRRPSFVGAAAPEAAEPWVDRFGDFLREEGVESVASGEFGANMQVELVNDGPVTLWIEKEPGAS